MKEKWLTPREAAEILNLSVRTIKKNIAKGKYVARKGRTKKGQFGNLIAFSSLPAALNQGLEESKEILELVGEIFLIIKKAKFTRGACKLNERRVIGAVAQMIDPNLVITKPS